MQRAYATRGLRFLPKLTLAITIGLITAAASYAVDVFTDPVGFITLTMQGTNGLSASSANSLLGLGMTQLPALAGAVSSVTSNAIVTGSTLTPGQFNFTADNHPAYFVEVLDGANPGLLDDITGNSATTLFTSTANAGNIAGATKFKVYPHWTIGTVFGPANQAGLKAGTTASAADQILVFNPLAQAFTTYYYSSGGLAGVGWRSPGTSPLTLVQSNVVLYLDQGVLVKKVGSLSTNLLLVGGVKLGTTIIPVVAGGNNFAGNVYASTNTLGGSNLHNAGPASGSVVGATTASAADNVLLFDSSTQAFTTYYWSTGGLAGVGWRKPGTSPLTLDQSGVVINIAQTLLIQRRAANGAMNWSAPSPY